ncbi:MAG: single-stranded DNA-binding protein [Bacteroidota bacterium]|nr:single-stranded DNA-binding protein [Bacteroidota bacterium]
MIKLTAIGNLGKDCTVNTVNNKTVINFSVAHTEKFKDSMGVQKDKTIWVECAYWTDRTAIAPYLKKGTQVYVEGTPDIRNYTTKEGAAATSLTLRVQNVQLIGGKNTEGGPHNEGTSAPASTNNYNNYNTQPSSQSVSQHQQEITEPMDDLPF